MAAADGPPPLFVAWTESLREDVNPLDRVNIIVERDKYDAVLSLHAEVEESGPEVGKPARTKVLHPVTRYVPETELTNEQARSARLEAALDAIVELSQDDMDRFDTIFGLAHDAKQTCAGCFRDGVRIK